MENIARLMSASGGDRAAADGKSIDLYRFVRTGRDEFTSRKSPRQSILASRAMIISGEYSLLPS